jgi:hypothetical protein
MNLDKITLEDIMDFLDIEEHTRETPEVRATVKKFMQMFLPTLEEMPEFIEFYNSKYGKEDINAT